MTAKLYHHKTDGGAEYLCSSPVDGTDEGDLYTAVVRLDGEPELLNPSMLVAPELLEALKALLIETDQHARGNCPKLKAACNRARELILSTP